MGPGPNSENRPRNGARDEAKQKARELDSKYTYGIHWGGIFFTQEPTYEPQEIIEKEMLQDPTLNFYTSIPGIIFDMP